MKIRMIFCALTFTSSLFAQGENPEISSETKRIAAELGTDQPTPAALIPEEKFRAIANHCFGDTVSPKIGNGRYWVKTCMIDGADENSQKRHALLNFKAFIEQMETKKVKAKSVNKGYAMILTKKGFDKFGNPAERPVVTASLAFATAKKINWDNMTFDLWAQLLTEDGTLEIK